jgi:hypothetical protein
VSCFIVRLCYAAHQVAEASDEGDKSTAVLRHCEMFRYRQCAVKRVEKASRVQTRPSCAAKTPWNRHYELGSFRLAESYSWCY